MYQQLMPAGMASTGAIFLATLVLSVAFVSASQVRQTPQAFEVDTASHSPSPALGYQPNIVFLLTDDQDARLGLSDEYTYTGSLEAMPALRANLMSRGAYLDNFLVTTPICCPSRTELMSGRYFHNVGPPHEEGGCMHVNTTHVVAPGEGVFPLLKQAGYRTGVFGKVTNDQPQILYVGTNLSAFDYVDSPCQYNDFMGTEYFRLFPNGTQYIEKIDEKHPVFSTPYQSTQIGNRTLRWLDEVLQDTSKPFFAYIGPHAPHYPATPAPWYEHLWDNVSAPVTPNFNASSPDKTQHIRQNPPLTSNVKCWEDQHFRDRWSSLKSVDEIIEAVIDKLEKANVLDKTFFFFTSDHGYKLGQWRVGTSKQHPYETDVHVPFVVRGPGVEEGTVIHNLAGNPDILPTLLDLAGVQKPSFMDGKSMLPFLVKQDALTPSFREANARDLGASWRDTLLVEYKSVGTYFNDHSSIWSDGTNTKHCGDGPPTGPAGKVQHCAEASGVGNGQCYFVDSTHSNSWRALRIMSESQGNLTYIEYDSSWAFNRSTIQFYELYDVTADPYQLKNIYNSTSQSQKDDLHQQISKYWACSGDECP